MSRQRLESKLQKMFLIWFKFIQIFQLYCWIFGREAKRQFPQLYNYLTFHLSSSIQLDSKSETGQSNYNSLYFKNEFLFHLLFHIVWCTDMICIFVLAIWELLNKSPYFPGWQSICLIQSITNKQENWNSLKCQAGGKFNKKTTTRRFSPYFFY